MGPRCQISQTQSFVDIHILVVDDDATSLAVVSAMLKMCRYQVVTVKSPVEALNTLRERKGKIDIVITDLHMPQMNGLQLQKQVKQEFNLPVVVMSADEKPSVILESLEEGVAFYMVKPISLHDLKHLWQYAITYKKVTLNQTTTVVRRGISIEKSTFKDSSSSASCSNEGKCAKSKNKKASTKGKENKVHKNSITIRKPKVVWTDSLHNRFLQAIRQIGLDKAVPKRILEFMNVPGLTRENVASHLQKYRIFLKRVAEKGASSLKNLPEYGIQRSNFASPHFPPPIYKHKFQSQFQFQFPYFSENHKMDCSLLNSQTILKRNFPIDLGLPNPNLEGTSITPNLINNNQLANNIRFNSFKFMETEKNGFSGGFTTVEDDRNRLGNVQVSSGVQNDGFGWKGGFEEVGKESLGFIMDQGLNDDQFSKMISDTNLHENASVLHPLAEGEKVDSWKETNEIDAFENMVEENVCFNGDFLGEISMEQNPNNQPSLREQGDRVEMLDADFSEIWNQIELDASTTEILSRPRFNSMEWDEGILEIMFGDNLPHREKVC